MQHVCCSRFVLITFIFWQNDDDDDDDDDNEDDVYIMQISFITPFCRFCSYVTQ